MQISKRLGISSLVIGLTVVALGTSFPELFVSTIASMRGESAVALGNVIGSNIFNIAVILALAAMIRPVHIELRLLQLEIPFVLFISVLFPLLALDGTIGRADAGILISLFAIYLFYVQYTAREDSPRTWPADTPPVDGSEPAPEGRLWLGLTMVLVGLLAMAFGGRWIVDSATQLARTWGVSERVIGLTLLAGGTSLPELASTLVAFTKREPDLAVGSLLGSNVFNTLAILGTASMVRPLSPTDDFLRMDLPVMLLSVVLLIPLARSRSRLGRWEGLGLFTLYVVYLAVLIFDPFGF